jgi:hypothetical protein
MTRSSRLTVASLVIVAAFAGRAAAQERYSAQALAQTPNAPANQVQDPTANVSPAPAQDQLQMTSPAQALPQATDATPAQALVQPQATAPTPGMFDIADDSPEKWDVYGGTVLLHRSAPASTPLITTGGPGTPSILDAANMNFGWMFGFDVGGTYNINDRWGIDLRYFQVAPWTATFGPTAVPSSVIVNRGLTTIDFGGSVFSQYQSNLRSAEINARFSSNSWWTALAGFRYLNLDESLSLQQFLPAGPIFQSWTYQTSNHLFGGQIGLEGLLYNSSWLTVDTYAKAGVYGTAAYAFFTQTFLGNASAAQGQVSFLGDGGLRATVRLNRWAAVEAGYQLMWLTGVALASDQFKANTGTAAAAPLAINSTGFVFYQGVTLGLKIQH